MTWRSNYQRSNNKILPRSYARPYNVRLTPPISSVRHAVPLPDHRTALEHIGVVQNVIFHNANLVDPLHAHLERLTHLEHLFPMAEWGLVVYTGRTMVVGELCL